MKRTPDNNFNLSTEIKKVSLKHPGGSKSHLGSINADLFLHDDYVQIKKIKLSDTGIDFGAKARIDLDDIGNISGESEYSISSEYISKDPILKSTLSGKTSISGNVDSLNVSGNLSSDPYPADINIDGETILSLSSLLAKFNLNYKNENLSINIPEASAVGENAYLSTKEALSINSKKNSGKLEAKIEDLELDFAKLGKTSLLLSLSGTRDAPTLKLEGSIDNVEVGNQIIPDVSLNALLSQDEINFKIQHQSKQQGELSLEGTLDLNTNGKVPVLKDTSYTLKNFSLLPKDDVTKTSGFKKSEFGLSGSGTMKGALTRRSLKSTAKLEILSITKEGASALEVELKISKGRLSLNAMDHADSISAKLDIDFLNRGNSLFEVKLKSFEPSDFFSGMECLETSGNLNYKFVQAKPKLGSGQFILDSLKFGCAPHTVKLAETISGKIQNGNLDISALKLKGTGSNIKTKGSISLSKGWDLRTDGELKLDALLPLFPSIDDIHGKLSANLNIKGAFDSPEFNGLLKIVEAGFAIEAADLLGRHLNGELNFKKDSLHIERFTGSVNDGQVDISGVLDPVNLNNSSISFEFKDLLFEPSKDSSVAASGNLALEQFESEEIGLAGNIEISSAEIRKDFNLKTIIRDVLELLRSASEKGIKGKTQALYLI